MTTGDAVLEHPWPPPDPRGRQPRDAHALQWSNDAGRARRGPASAGDERSGWPDRAPVPRPDAPARRRASGGRPTDAHDEPRRGHSTRDDGPREHPARPLPARWLPQEEWIPDPAPAPEQRWTPEQDWLAAFAGSGPAEAAVPPAPGPRRAARRRLVLGVVVALPLVAVVEQVVAAL